MAQSFLENIKNYITETETTSRGHLDYRQKNIAYSSKNNDYDDNDMRPTIEAKTNNVYVVYFVSYGDGILYSHLTIKFPVTSLEGNKYILVLQHYDSNGILTKALPNFFDEEITQTCNKFFTFLKSKGFSPILNVLNNEASAAVIQKSKNME